MKAWLPLAFLSVSALSAAPQIVPAPNLLSVDLAALARKNPFLQYRSGLRLKAGTAIDLNHALLYLNFDEPAAPLLKDIRGLYRVLEADYTPGTDAQSGDRSAFFRFRRQMIRLRTTEDLWPLKHQHTFTISFWIKPRHFFRSSNLFRRMAYASGERKGMEILLEQDRLKLNLEGILTCEGEVEPSRSIPVRRSLMTDRWYHLAVSFDLRKSTVHVFLDGKEEERFRLCRDGRTPEIDFGGPELAPIQIGGNFIGQIDELMILTKALSEESDLDTSPYGQLRYSHQSGRGTLPVAEAVTEVFQLAGASESMDITANGEAPPGSSLRLYYRISDAPFHENNRTLPWIQFADLARGGSYRQNVPQTGRYVQLKAEWQPDPTGTTGPVLKALAIEQHPIAPPIRPEGVRIIEELSRDGRICLEWRINPEIEIEERGGYLIHAGVRPGEYEAVLQKIFVADRPVLIRRSNMNAFPLTAEEQRLEKLRPERIREWKRSHIRVFLDNDLLSRARFIQNAKRALPYFERNHPYYFAVSAYIHEQAPSKLSDPALFIYRE